ncbi:hypothetical protein [Xylanimonas ulmi]|uniref:Transcriptional regulator, AbiEi antitoxin, Type IV TA system n=2 Tax=Xylanimonas ulmi TaxID=228973 RepID=A0A4Q7M5W3_9MICO|nr:hypothetical protein EV386_2359 [Xylanibacterium ulmi]
MRMGSGVGVEAELRISREHNRDELRRDLAAGRAARIRRGAYTGPEPLTADASARARILAVHEQLSARRVFGFDTAALLYGLPTWSPSSRVHIFVRSRASSRSAKDIARHTTDLTPEDVATIDGLPVTTLTRTVVDCALTMHPLEALVIADGAMNRGFDRQLALAQITARAQPNGRARAEWVITNAAAGTRSPWESWLRYLPLREGFPSPEIEPPILTRLGVMHLDLGWPPYDLYVEFDGRVKYRDDGVRTGHSAEQELLAEKRRFDAIRETGVNPLRVMASDGAHDYMRRLRARLPPDLRRSLRVNPRLPWPPPRVGTSSSPRALEGTK